LNNEQRELAIGFLPGTSVENLSSFSNNQAVLIDEGHQPNIKEVERI
jgi:hypothetical protein